ncbi:MAG TPA: ROK family protein [Trebonia sp.]|jgi:predicted NBD/HSP70 family sugar kinase
MPGLPGHAGQAQPARAGRSGLPGAALTLIHTGQAPTRSALTAALGVTRATAGAVTAELRDLGLIQVGTGTRAGTQGRPSYRLAIDTGGPVALAAQLHPDGFAVALVGLGGRIVARTSHQGPVPGDPARALAPLAEAGAGMLRRSGRACAGVGLVVPSAVSEPEGAAVSPLYLDWPTGAKVRDVFASLLADHGIGRRDGALTCVAVNDVNALALAEHRHGAGRGAAYLLVVAAEHRGVGGALVLRGALYTGSGGLSMEAGHVSVDPNGRPCPCGNRGCLNVETDAARFLEAAGRVPAPRPAVLDQAIAILAAEYDSDPQVRPDPQVSRAVGTLVQHLGLGLAGLINVVNPDRVLLGGLHKHLLLAAPDQLREAVAVRSPWGRGAGVPIHPCAVDDGELIGAAELAWQPVLDDPSILAAG